jgi:hypothetical protein
VPGDLAVVDLANTSVTAAYDIEFGLADGAADAECAGAVGAFVQGGPPGLPKRARLGPLSKQVKATAQAMPPMPGPAPPPATAVGFLHIDNGHCSVRARARVNKHPLPPTSRP